jgi:1-acyl-sn-glycerol-3-phosphate acyltransferase
MQDFDPGFFHSALQFARAVMAYHRYEVRGVEHIPVSGPALIVVNHSLATYDALLLGAAIYMQTGRRPVGLADRRVFQTPLLAETFRKLGAVEGSPEAAVRLLSEGNLLELSPGGMRESLRPSSRRYHVDWEGRLGFARLAIQCQVPVILAACPAADDIYTVYGNPITSTIYRHFKWPAPLARGLGLTAIPRPVKLTHYLHAPIRPPRARGEKALHSFHKKLVTEMEHLLHAHAPKKTRA